MQGVKLMPDEKKEYPCTCPEDYQHDPYYTCTCDYRGEIEDLKKTILAKDKVIACLKYMGSFSDDNIEALEGMSKAGFGLPPNPPL